MSADKKAFLKCFIVEGLGYIFFLFSYTTDKKSEVLLILILIEDSIFFREQ